MGRTRRKRKKNQKLRDHDLTNIINLKKSLRLRCPNITVDYYDDFGWGVRAKKNIKEGDILIALPFHHLITTDVPCDIFKILNIQNQPPQVILSVFLVYEYHLKEKSKYFEYIKSLPESFTNPYFCTKNEIKLLPEFIKKEVVDHSKFINSNIKNLFEIINNKSCPHCKENLKSIFIFEKIVWAWFNVNTRSVHYHDNKKTKSLALAPFLDLFNHSNNAVTEVLIDFVDKLYILKSFIGYKKFEQVFIKYGSHTNLKLLLEYGFILPENDYDFIEFSFEEVLECVRQFDCTFGGISKLKYNFVKSNKLHENLIKTTDFSWHFQKLVYVLITEDQNLTVLQAKTYSNLFTLAEKNAIQKICEIGLKKKFEEFQQNLAKMEEIQNCTASFKLIKNLIKSYLKMLQ